MQVKSEATDLLSALKGKEAQGDSSNLLGGVDTSVEGGEFGELLNKAAGKLSSEDANESLLNLMNSEVSKKGLNSENALDPEKVLKPEGMGKIVQNAKAMTDEELSGKLEIFGQQQNLLKGSNVKFESHDKLTSPELVQQFSLENNQVELKATKVSPENLKLNENVDLKNVETQNVVLKNVDVKNVESKNIDLKNILNGELTKNSKNQPLVSKEIVGEVKQEVVHPLSKMNSQSSSDFIEQLKAAQSGKVNEKQVENLKELGQKSQVNLYGKEQNTINKKLIALKGGKEQGAINNVKALKNDKSINRDISELTSGKSNEGSQNILNLMEQTEGKITVDKTVAPRPVVNLSSVNAENKIELIGKITNYIEQSNISKSDSVDVLVRHDELGTFQITANKNGGNGEMVELKVNTLTEQGKTFFVENEAELLKSLKQSGIKVSDFKVTNGKDFLGMSDMKGQSFEKSFSDNSSGQGQSNQRGFSQNFSGREDSQRRKNLWQQYEEYQQAYA